MRRRHEGDTLGGVLFEFFRTRFDFEAVDSVHFAGGNSTNILRGAFGMLLRKVACTSICGAGHDSGCAYARIFEPRQLRRNGPSGLADWPRPFILRARHLDGRTLQPAENFHFYIHLFDPQIPLLTFIDALKQLATEGLGPRRGRVRLAGVEQLDTDDRVMARLWNGVDFSPLVASSAAPLDVEPCHAVHVRFLTPTELKCEGKPVERPEFPVLFARIRDRLSTLRALYGPGPLKVDFGGMGERAAQIRMTRWELRSEHRVRRSSSTGQVHPWGGFTGEAEYQGDLTEFMPYLHAAQWTGVGRQTVWGKGEIAVTPSADPLIRGS